MADKSNDNIFTLEQYILNPMGKSNAVLNAATREVQRQLYEHRFDNILLRENGKIEYHLFKDDSKNEYWAYIKVPSEKVPKFYYDIVFKFYADESIGGTNNLFKYKVKFFSNDPAFTYTYAYVFKNNNLLIEELRSKMSKESLKQEPVEKNPNENIGYVKTIYFAYIVMNNRGLNKINRFEAECTPLDPKFLIKNIQNVDDKIADRQEQGKGISSRKKIVLDKKLARTVSKYMDSNIEDTTNSRFVVATDKKMSIHSKVATKPKASKAPKKSQKKK